MTATRSGAAHSPYLHWVRAQAPVRYNLAVSGMPDVPLAQLPQLAADLELTTRHAYGYPPLLQAVADCYGAAAANVVTVPGCSMANHLAMAALIRRGDELLLERPVYQPLLSLALYLGAQVRFLERRPGHSYALDAAAAAAAIGPATRLIVLTNPHNPSGALADEATLRHIGAAAAAVGAHVLVDEAYLDLACPPPRRSAFSLGPQFLVSGSLTKVYGLSGLRCGWVLAEAGLAQRLWRLNDLFGINHPHAAERMSAAAFSRLERLHQHATAVVAANRRALQALYQHRGEPLAGGGGVGTTAFPALPGGAGASAFCARLRRHYETAVVPGRFFGAPGHFRIGLTADPVLFLQALERLDAALDEWRVEARAKR